MDFGTAIAKDGVTDLFLTVGVTEMKSTIRSTLIAASAFALMGLSQAVAAPQFVVSNTSGGTSFLGSFETVRLSTNSGSSYSNVSAGAFGLRIDSYAGAPAPVVSSGLAENFITYCFELTETLTLPTAYEARLLTPGMSSADAALIERLWDKYFNASITSGTVVYGALSTNVTERSAAFQAAIWNIITEGADNELDAASGAFRVAGTALSGSDKIRDLTTYYLQQAFAHSAGTKLAGLYAPYVGGPTTAPGQNLLIECTAAFGKTDPRCDGPGGVVDTPVPATLVLFGAGLLALAGMRRRKA